MYQPFRTFILCGGQDQFDDLDIDPYALAYQLTGTGSHEYFPVTPRLYHCRLYGDGGYGPRPCKGWELVSLTRWWTLSTTAALAIP